MAVHLLMSPLPRPAQRHLTKPASHMQCVITADGRTAIELIYIEIVSSQHSAGPPIRILPQETPTPS
jgi:hypothetical protein